MASWLFAKGKQLVEARRAKQQLEQQEREKLSCKSDNDQTNASTNQKNAYATPSPSRKFFGGLKASVAAVRNSASKALDYAVDKVESVAGVADLTEEERKNVLLNASKTTIDGQQQHQKHQRQLQYLANPQSSAGAHEPSPMPNFTKTEQSAIVQAERILQRAIDEEEANDHQQDEEEHKRGRKQQHQQQQHL